MRKMLAAASLAATVSLATIAWAQTKPLDQPMPQPYLATEQVAPPIQDARALASDQEVAEGRRAYRSACAEYQTAEYCDCVTAGVAQALMPAEVHIAARTIGERINAEGDAYAAAESDNTSNLESTAARIEQIEARYADACVQFRG